MDIDQIIKALEILKSSGFNLPIIGGSGSGLQSNGGAVRESQNNEDATLGIQINTDSVAVVNVNEGSAQTDAGNETANPNRVIDIDNTSGGNANQCANGNKGVNGDSERIVHDAEKQQQTKTFAQVLQGSLSGAPLSVSRPPRVEGGNVIVEVDQKDYEQECRECQYDVIGRVVLQKGDKPYSTNELKTKLAQQWKIQNFEITHLSKGFYHVFSQEHGFPEHGFEHG